MICSPTSARHWTPCHDRCVQPAPYRRSTRTLLSPIRWLVRLNPLKSWLVVMAVIILLSWLHLRLLALLVAVTWTAYAIYTWVSPSRRRRLRRWR